VVLPKQLTVAEALRLARTLNPDVIQAAIAVDSARADLTIASMIQNPGVSSSVGKTFNYHPADCHGCSDIPWSVGLSDQGSLADLLIGKRRLRKEAAERALSATKDSRYDAERQLVSLVKQRYLAVSLAKESLGFAAENLASAVKTQDLVKIRYQTGLISEADVTRAEVATLEASQAADQAEAALEQANVSLMLVFGLSGEPTFEIGTEYQQAVIPPPLANPTRESLLGLALERRPDLRAAKKQVESAESSAALARRQRWPDVSFSAQYSQEGTSTNSIQPPTASFGMSFTLPVFYQEQGEVAKAEAAVRSQKVDYQKLLSEVNGDVENGLSAFESACLRVKRMDSSLLLAAERSFSLTKVQYEKGAASLLELLDAQRTLIGVKTERLQILDDFWTAVFQLEAAVGTEFGS
jgi:cobalt-zinc-cadmium efflux system outer membrane protein